MHIIYNIHQLPLKTPYYIYGSGSCAKFLYDYLKNNGNTGFKGFIDREVPKDSELPFYEKNSFLENTANRSELVIIASSAYKEILPSFQENGFSHVIIYPNPGFENCCELTQSIVWNHPCVKDPDFRRDGFIDEGSLQESILKIIDYTMVNYDGLLSLADIVRYLEEKEIDGELVELGCCNGGATGLMADINLQYAKNPRNIHAFDSFEGLPQPIEGKDNAKEMIDNWGISTENQAGKLVSTGKLVAQEAKVLDLIINKIGYPSTYFKIHKGWFQNTVPPAKEEIDKIALLRLDGDLYESTYIGLEHFYAKIVPGGFIILDDWGLEGARNAVEDFFQKNDIHLYRNHVDKTVCYWQKPL